MLTTLLAALLSAPDVHGYDGRFAEHPNLPALVAVIEETLDEADDLVPRWISRKLPEIEVRLIDMDKPAPGHPWPASVRAGALGVQGGVFTVEIAVDPLIGVPERGRAALTHGAIEAALMAEALSGSLDFARINELSFRNPVLAAVGSFLAGDMEQELDYLLSKHLDSDEELASTFADIVEPPSKGGSRWEFEDRPDDDVTFLMLVRTIAPRGKDKKVEDLYKAIFNGQPVEGALKKPTRKKLPKLNPELRKTFEEYLEERFPAKAREAWRALAAARDASDWPGVLSAVEAFLEDHADSLAGPNARWWRARALAETDPEMARPALEEILRDLRNATPHAWKARLHLALLEAAAGDAAAARTELEGLKLEFGWIPEARDRAKQELAALQD